MQEVLGQHRERLASLWSGQGAAAAAPQSQDHGQAVVRDVLRDVLQHLYPDAGPVLTQGGDAVEAVQALNPPG